MWLLKKWWTEWKLRHSSQLPFPLPWIFKISLPFSNTYYFLSKGWPALYKESTRGLKGCNCLKDQLTNSQGNSRWPINWEEDQGEASRTLWTGISWSRATFSRQYLSAFPWQLDQRARVVLEPVPWPLGIDDTTKQSPWENWEMGTWIKPLSSQHTGPHWAIS